MHHHMGIQVGGYLSSVERKRQHTGPEAARDTCMFRSKFSSVLREERVKVASRYKFDFDDSCQDLFSYVRTVDMEEESPESKKDKRPVLQQPQSAEGQVTQKLDQALGKLGEVRKDCRRCQC